MVGLDENRLYPSVYEEDDEAFDIWNKEIGVPADRIFRFGKEDNFWSTAQVLAVRVLRFTMTVEKNTAVANRAVPWDVTVTVIWKYGTTYLPSSKMTGKVIMRL